MTPTEKLQAEAEQLYPYDASIETGTSEWGIDQEITDMQRAAHLACAEKYTAIIEQKDKEIERLQRFVFNVRDWAMPMDYRGIAKMQEIADDVLKANIALKTQTP